MIYFVFLFINHTDDRPRLTTMTNKNLQSLPSSFQEIVCPDFDSRLEVYEWIIYQQKELLLLFQCYFTHRVRTTAFVSYFNKANCHIRNALSLSKYYEETTDALEKIPEIKYLANETDEGCQKLRSFPLI